MLNAVNNEYRNEGLGALCHNDKLINAAQIYSDNIESINFLSYTSLDDSSNFKRMIDIGFEQNSAAENVMQRQKTI